MRNFSSKWDSQFSDKNTTLFYFGILGFSFRLIEKYDNQFFTIRNQLSILHRNSRLKAVIFMP